MSDFYRDVAVGRLFTKDGSLHIKTPAYDIYNAVSLITGHSRSIPDDWLVDVLHNNSKLVQDIRNMGGRKVEFSELKTTDRFYIMNIHGDKQHYMKVYSDSKYNAVHMDSGNLHCFCHQVVFVGEKE